MGAENIRLLPFPDKGGNGIYAATFRDNLSVPTSCDNKFLTLEEGADKLFQKSVSNYHLTRLRSQKSTCLIYIAEEA
jgi:hypothetical protein